MTYQLDGVEHLALLGELLHVHLRHKTHSQSTSAQTATLNLTIFLALYMHGCCLFIGYMSAAKLNRVAKSATWSIFPWKDYRIARKCHMLDWFFRFQGKVSASNDSGVSRFHISIKFLQWAVYALQISIFFNKNLDGKLQYVETYKFFYLIFYV